jgi:hypothetical protein
MPRSHNKKGQRLHIPSQPETMQAQGLSWLMRYINGAFIKDIASEAHVHPKIVSARMKAAAESLTDQLKEQLLNTLVPKAIKVYGEMLDKQSAILAGDDEGLTVGKADMRYAERVLKALYFFDAPLPKPERKVLMEGEDGEPEEQTMTLERLVATKKIGRTANPVAVEAAQLSGVIEGEVNGH